MISQTQIKGIDRPQVISSLARIREEWTDNTDGSLIETHASVGLLLADIARALNLNAEEQVHALGADLFEELVYYLGAPEKTL
ncbi:MAG: hypothetical protein EHM70_25810 [Chloroflexota bacterium]|nr:MAG: hypothetical protein EHM70_25810 [Chloroflexota bacterium]